MPGALKNNNNNRLLGDKIRTYNARMENGARHVACQECSERLQHSYTCLSVYFGQVSGVELS